MISIYHQKTIFALHYLQRGLMPKSFKLSFYSIVILYTSTTQNSATLLTAFLYIYRLNSTQYCICVLKGLRSGTLIQWPSQICTYQNVLQSSIVIYRYFWRLFFVSLSCLIFFWFTAALFEVMWVLAGSGVGGMGPLHRHSLFVLYSSCFLYS